MVGTQPAPPGLLPYERFLLQKYVRNLGPYLIIGFCLFFVVFMVPHGAPWFAAHGVPWSTMVFYGAP